MAVAAILDFRIHKILLANGVWRSQSHHCAKFSCGYIAIIQIFKMITAAILYFWNH